MRLQSIYDIAEICARQGISNAVVCPGSRCAPITIAFARHPDIITRTFSDERSAGFIANGLTIETGKPTVLICTSGSAAYNFAPAVAEAFFQHLPLLVLTADRPAEWIDQLDGQTIRQTAIYGKHVKQSFEIPQDEHSDSVWYSNRVINEAINLAKQFPQGPVQINIPIREPFYPEPTEVIKFTNPIRIIQQKKSNQEISEENLSRLKAQFISFSKVLIVAGQSLPHAATSDALERFSQQHRVPVVTDIISNQHLTQSIQHADAMLSNCNPGVKQALRPELLITFGNSVISKSLKLFLRQHNPLHHWHIQPGGQVADTFQSLTEVIQTSPENFFRQLEMAVPKTGFEAQKRENYYHLWEAEENRTQRAITSFFASPELTEFHLVNEILKHLPDESQLHLANSMAVRYANLIGVNEKSKGIHVFSNRGTSGIDGCTSTAVGQALVTSKPVVLITGDMAFFYDRNAFWHNYKLPNLRIVLLNNHGGTIFSMIDGPAGLPESDEYFVTHQRLNGKSISSEFDIDYLKLDNLRKLKNTLKDFFDFEGRTKLLEIETEQKTTKEIMDRFKSQIRKNYES